MPKQKVTIIGALPVDLVCATLDVELEPGDVILTAQAERHIAKDHPADYAIVMQCLPAAIATPTYIGQSPHHGSAFEMVRRITLAGTTEVILVAINLTRNEFGNYNIHSAYRITEAKVDARVRAKHLLNPKK